MSIASIAVAKAHLSALVDSAVGGEPVVLTRRGKPVAHITAASAPRKRVDLGALRSLVADMPVQTEPAGAFIRRLRDDERY